MNSLFWACLALAAWPSVFAMYFTGDMEIFRPPADRTLRDNSYFGYSITYDSFRKKLMISSPRENDIGIVYNCDIPSESCGPITVNFTRGAFPKYTHDYWLGATIKAGPDFVMMCAPRFMAHTVRKSDNTGFNADITQGRCFTLKPDGNILNNRGVAESAINRDSPSPMEATMDSFGWSIDVTSSDHIVVGGPGMFTGRVMVYNNYENVPELVRHKDTTKIKFNFGYAVASGNFINTFSSIAVGSTYGKDGVGEVHFFTTKRRLHQQALNKEIDKDEVGSMFGAVLCAAKLFGMKDRTDLLVGAPTFATKNTYNLGAVYVYLALKNGKVPAFKRKIVGKVSGAMFGSAIVNVKDLNNDGRDEIAIGAPFEKDGRGAVYLYSGADLISELTDKMLTPLQKIEPQGPNVKSFGMSLSPLLDYDQNGCNELAIGSPYDNTVVLYRCITSVTLKEIRVNLPDLQNRVRDNIINYQIGVCLLFEYPTLPENITAIITTTVELDHENAMLDYTTPGPYTYDTPLERAHTEYCQNVAFKLPLEGKYETGVIFTVSSKLKVDPRTLPDFHSTRVILSDRSVLSTQKTLWAAECAGKICVPKLKLTPFISFDKPKDKPYIIGSSIKGIETISMTVENTGEVAYEPCVRVHFDGVNVLVPGGCVYESSTNGHRLKCEPQKPIRTGETWTTGAIQVEMNHLTNKDKVVEISMDLYDHCSINDKKQPFKKSIPLKADPRGITAKGETDIGDIVNMSEKDIKENGKKIVHEYKISNSGPTDWADLLVEVTLNPHPYILYNGDAVEVGLSTAMQNKPCNLKENTTSSATYLCMVDSLLARLQYAQVYVPMFILPGTLDGLLDKEHNITITSSIKVIPIEGEYSVSEGIKTTIRFQEPPIPIQTIIIAVVVGLCILIIIALILYRIGFLQRKKREELKRLQKSVKRQTILRRSTMPSQSSARGSAEDRKQILQEMNEEDKAGPSLT